MAIAFLGLGVMGTAIASNVIKLGERCYIWNRTTSVAQKFVDTYKNQYDIQVANWEDFKQCNIIFTCIAKGEHVIDLMIQKKIY